MHSLRSHLCCLPNDIESFVAVQNPFVIPDPLSESQRSCDRLRIFSLGDAAPLLWALTDQPKLEFAVGCCRNMRTSRQGTLRDECGVVGSRYWKRPDLFRAESVSIAEDGIYSMRTVKYREDAIYFQFRNDVLLWSSSKELLLEMLNNSLGGKCDFFLDYWPLRPPLNTEIFGGSHQAVPAFHRDFMFEASSGSDSDITVRMPVYPTSTLDILCRPLWLVLLGRPDLRTKPPSIDRRILMFSNIGFAVNTAIRVILNISRIRLGIRWIAIRVPTNVSSKEGLDAIIMMVLGGLGHLGGGF